MRLQLKVSSDLERIYYISKFESFPQKYFPSMSNYTGIDALTGIEKDSADKEDIPNLLQYALTLHPKDKDSPVIDPEKCAQLSVNFNRNVFDGWVKQPSPCCAAAAVAGKERISTPTTLSFKKFT